MKKTVAGITTKYLVDPQNPTGYAQVVQENFSGSFSANREVSRVFVYGLERISQYRQFVANGQSQTQTSYYAYDGHGSTRALTDPNGVVTDTYDYDAFGNLIHSTATGIPPGGTTFAATPNEFLFAGEQFDSDLGLYYNRARYLNVSTGRFWTMDTDEGNDQAPPSLHKYLYGQTDPVDYSDPSGNEIDVMAGLAISMNLDILPSAYYYLGPNYSLFGGFRNATSLSARGLERIKIYESPVFLHGDPDSDNNCTIGYGHVFDWGNGCTPADRNRTITEPAASALLQSDIADKTKDIHQKIYVPLAQQELDALISFVFNAGLPPSIVGQLNLNHYSVIPVFFRDYIYTTTPTGKKVKSRGLIARREDESVYGSLVFIERWDSWFRDSQGAFHEKCCHLFIRNDTNCGLLSEQLAERNRQASARSNRIPARVAEMRG